MLNWIKTEIKNESAYRRRYAPHQTIAEAAAFAAILMIVTAFFAIA